MTPSKEPSGDKAHCPNILRYVRAVYCTDLQNRRQKPPLCTTFRHRVPHCNGYDSFQRFSVDQGTFHYSLSNMLRGAWLYSISPRVAHLECTVCGDAVRPLVRPPVLHALYFGLSIARNPPRIYQMTSLLVFPSPTRVLEVLTSSFTHSPDKRCRCSCPSRHCAQCENQPRFSAR